ncbi:MAG: hypothetical protein BGO49_24525 [Planctomycetales bacterium 71-10]|nr:MAG: hypothetical protein BGO49_24525 [Planctomycetales bacterium 71-10]
MADEPESQPKPGQPTKYKPEYCEQVKKLALLGLTDVEMAEFFEVCEDTFYEWKKVHPEFSEAASAGKVKADAEIAHSLYDRAKGAQWTEQAAFKIRNQTGPGQFTEEVQIVEVRKAAPPDTQAASLWLRNRRPKSWRDTQHIEQTVAQVEAPTEFTSPEEAARAYAEAVKGQ